ncbi:MAG: type II secretion system protein [Planctomycetota bacterium]|nr:type II secretion system protein [Planctomycetota bacterium]
MIRSFRHRAFTLLELLTVIAIITLLIGILTPSLGKARDKAKEAATQSMYSQLTTGMEMFKNDHGKYPASNARDYINKSNPPNGEFIAWAFGSQSSPLQGANLLVDALFGRDLVGFDPKPSSNSAPPYERWDFNNPRSEPYVDPDKVDFSKQGEPVEDAIGILPPDEATPVLGNTIQIYCRVILDKFERTVLYYRANPNATQRTPILPIEYGGGGGANNPTVPGVYNGRDNNVFTEHNDFENSDSPLNDLSKALNPIDSGQPADAFENNFAKYIMSNRQSSLTGAQPWVRPANSRTFILMSPGKDGKFNGPNNDDITNFERGDQ